MADTQGPKKIKIELPSVTREPAHNFHSKGDYELYLLMCDHIDEGAHDELGRMRCDFYRKKINQGFVLIPDGTPEGTRKRYYRR